MGRPKKDRPAADKKRRSVSIELLDREGPSGETAQPYFIMDRLIEEYHEELSDARIAIAWRMSEIREDSDGQIEFGRVKRGADLDRALAPYDFVLIVAHEVWNREKDETRLEAMLDWLLCQCMPVTKDGEQVVDEKDRLCWRLRKPLRVFPENVGRYGLWNAEPIDEAIKRHNDAKRTLLNQQGASKRSRRNGFADPAVSNEPEHAGTAVE